MNKPFHGFFQVLIRTSSLANIHRYYWKERLKISKLAKFGSDKSEVSENIALQSRKIDYRRLYGGGHKLAPQTSE